MVFCVQSGVVGRVRENQDGLKLNGTRQSLV